MHVATLIAAPSRADLSAATVDSVRAGWGGGAADWLAPGIAADIPLDARPEDLWQVWERLQAEGVDLVVQPAAGRRKRVLLADMDSTIIGQECVDELAEVVGVGAEVRAITDQAMRGDVDFEGALRARVALLAGLSEAVLAEVYETRIRFTPGAETLVATMRAHGAYAALVSGGFTAFTARVAAALGFDEHRANTLILEAGRLTGRVAEPILGRDAKVAALRRIVGELGIDSEDVLAVGDGANDLGMLGLAGAGVAFHAKPAVAAACDLRVNHGDLTALLYLQGFRQADFA